MIVFTLWISGIFNQLKENILQEKEVRRIMKSLLDEICGAFVILLRIINHENCLKFS